MCLRFVLLTVRPCCHVHDMCLSGSWKKLALSAWQCCSLQGEKKKTSARIISKLEAPHLYQISCSMASSPSQSAYTNPIKSWWVTLQYKKADWLCREEADFFSSLQHLALLYVAIQNQLLAKTVVVYFWLQKSHHRMQIQ